MNLKLMSLVPGMRYSSVAPPRSRPTSASG